MGQLSTLRPTGGGGGSGIKGNWDVTPSVTPGAPGVQDDIYPAIGASYTPGTGVLTSPATAGSSNFADGAVVTFSSADAFSNTFSKFLTITDELGGGAFVFAGFIDSTAAAADVRTSLEAAFFNTPPPGTVTQMHGVYYFSVAGGWDTASFVYSGSWNTQSSSIVGAGERTVLLNRGLNLGNQSSFLVTLTSTDGNSTFTNVANAEVVSETLDVPVGFFSVTLKPFFAVFTVGAPFGSHSATPFDGHFNPTATLGAVTVPVGSDFDLTWTPNSQAVFDSSFPSPRTSGLETLPTTTQATFPNGTAINDEYRIVGSGAPYGVSVAAGAIVTVDNIGVGTESFRTRQYKQEDVPGVTAAVDVTYDNLTSGLTSTDVQGAVDETVVLANSAQSAAGAAQTTANQGVSDAAAALSTAGQVGTDLSNHLSDTTDAHDASAISFDDSVAQLGATDVQAAIVALDSSVGSIQSSVNSVVAAEVEVFVTGSANANGVTTFQYFQDAWAALVAKLNSLSMANVHGTIWLVGGTVHCNLTGAVLIQPTNGRISVKGVRSAPSKPMLLFRFLSGQSSAFNPGEGLPYLDYVEIRVDTFFSSSNSHTLQTFGGNYEWVIGDDVSFTGFNTCNGLSTSVFRSSLIDVPNMGIGALQITFGKNLSVYNYSPTTQWDAVFSTNGGGTGARANLILKGSNFRVIGSPSSGATFRDIGVDIFDSGQFVRVTNPLDLSPTSTLETPASRIRPHYNSVGTPASAKLKIFNYDFYSNPVCWPNWALDVSTGVFDPTISELTSDSLYSIDGIFLNVGSNLDLTASQLKNADGNKVTIRATGSISISGASGGPHAMNSGDVFTFLRIGSWEKI